MIYSILTFVFVFTFHICISTTNADSITAPTSQPTVDNNLTYTISIPLDQGRLELGNLLGAIADVAGLDGQSIRQSVRLGIDVHSTIGQAKIKAIARLTNGIITFHITQDAVEMIIDRAQLRREEKQLRTRIRKLMKDWFPNAAANATAQYGMWLHTNPDDWSDRSRPNKANVNPLTPSPPDQPTRDTVILIHGLDDPGKVWRSLIPELLDEGFTVLRFEYPNDQPISESTDMLAAELANLHQMGISQVDLVAHSMGGLVSREFLTNPKYQVHEEQNLNPYPVVDRLIMIGTPNHGSELARLRLAAEMRDQVERLLMGETLLLASIFDGAGEAKLDLLPESDFLVTLNNRPNPPDVKMTIIAGVTSPITSTKVKQLTDQLREKSDEKYDNSIYEIGKAMQYIVDGVGDGLVSLQSTRISEVQDHKIVQGNHLSMIRNLTAASGNNPPAIPIVINRLHNRDGIEHTPQQKSTTPNE